MEYFKTLGLFAIAATTLIFTETAMAQTAPQSEALNPAPVNKTVPRSRVRVVKALPVMARPVSATKGKLYARALYTRTANGRKSKFVIHDKANKVLTPVYFSKDALKSR